jgi:hypothetical protein
MIKKIIFPALAALTLLACGNHEYLTILEDLSSSSKISSSSSEAVLSSSSLAILKCGNHDYDPATHICKDGELQEISTSGGGIIPSSSSISSGSKSSSSKNTSSSSSKETSSSSKVALSSSSATVASSSSVKTPFDDIKFWVGKGSKKAMLVVQWNDGKTPDALAWGYKWDGTKYGYDMINDIAKEDKRFFYIKRSGTTYGAAIGGLGFDFSSNNNIQLSNDNGLSCKSPIDGSIDTDGYDFDNWKLCDGTNARWGAGWYVAYWSYWVSDDINGKWKYSDLGASSRVLKDNSVDAWYLDLDMNDPNTSSFLRCMVNSDNCDGRNFFGDITPVNAPR